MLHMSDVRTMKDPLGFNTRAVWIVSVRPAVMTNNDLDFTKSKYIRAFAI